MTTSIKTNNGRKIIVNRAYKSSPDYTCISQFKIGENNGAVTVTSTSIDEPIPIQNTESVDDCDATTGWTPGTDSAVSLNTTTKKQGTGSLSLAKSGTTGTSMNAVKTTTSRDFTSKDLRLWIYIAALSDLVSTGTAVSIRFGSDGSNYYQFNIPIGDLVAGWNQVIKQSTDADSTTGTPTITACDYTEIIANVDLAADTIAADRFMVDEIILASSTDYFKNFDATYPTIDETNMEAQFRATVASTQGNGHTINAIGLFNTDGTPLMGSVDLFTAETKDSTDEFVFVLRERII